MSDTYQVLRVFISSPDDVAEECVIVAKLIREQNKAWGPHLGLILEEVMWETAVHPGIADRPQEVINKQVEDKYDIFLGVMATRFGTLTGNAGSGTEEEFNTAYDRYLVAPDDIQIMFYFGAAPIDWTKHDLEQLALVKQFRERVADKGELYAIYRSLHEFTDLVRLNLAQVTREWGDKWGRGKKMNARSS